MEIAKETVQFAALVPHGNTTAKMEQERKTVVKNNALLPFYPLVCPLFFLPQKAANNHIAILADLQEFFYTKNRIAVFPPTKHDNFLYRLIDSADFSSFAAKNKMTREDEKRLGSFVLRTGRFLYGKLPVCIHSQTSIYNAAQPDFLRVFKISVFSLSFFYSHDNKNACFEWTEENERWIKLSKDNLPIT